MKKRILTSLFMIVSVVVVGFLVSTTNNANAESISLDNVYKKILLNEMEQCFTDTDMYSEVHVGTVGGSDPLEYMSFSTNILKRGRKESSGVSILLPTGMGSGNELDDDVTTSGIGCYELFLGDAKDIGTYGGTMTGLLSLTGHNAPYYGTGNQDGIRNFLKNFGYTKQEDINENSSNGQSCVKIRSEKNFSESEINNIESLYAGDISQDVAKICWSKEFLESSSYINFENATIEKYKNDLTYVGFDEYGTVYFEKKYSDKEWCMDISGQYAQGDGCGYNNGNGQYVSVSFKISKDKKLELVGTQQYTLVFYGEYDDYIPQAYTYDVYVDFYDDNSTSDSSIVKAQKFTMADNAYLVAREFLGGSGVKEEITPEEQYKYYISYIENVYGMDIISSTCTNEKPTMDEAISGNIIKRNNGWCQHTYNNDNNKNVSVFPEYSSNNSIYALTTMTDAKGVIGRLYLLADTIDEEDIAAINNEVKDEQYEYEVQEKTDPCFEVAESLGWIVCPLIKKMGEAASGLYAQVSQEFIVIDAGFFEGGNSPIRIAWNDIVGFANAIMVIFLLVVVFSQITGVGIDNYGIKKVLPKIIIAAILINLSFLICQLAVELSNILGDALNTMFTNWAKNIPLETVSGQKIEEGKGLFFGLLNAISGGMLGLGAAEGASIALTIASAESTGVAIAGAVMSIIIPLLCALIIVIVAVFFFFILLGVRKACVIVLVVISPLAFVCYMLPNTKALFQKWWNALKGMLMLYPICGLMIGGGYYVSKLITSTSGNYFVQFTALLLMVVPYFFIPKMLTNSLAAMGSIGAKISGFGKNFGRRMSKSTRDASGRLGGAIKGTNRFKDWQERSAEKRTAGIVDRLRNKQKNGELSKYQTRKLAKYQSAANESYAKNLSREAVANEMHQEAVKANLDEKFADDSVRSAMSLYKNGGQYDINDVKGTGDRSMNAAYAAAIADYNGNKSSDNLAKIKALQNILSGTEDGRNIIQRNLSQAAMSGNADAVDTAKAAASHLLSEHGGTYKAANRSLHSMVTDMANGNVAGAASQYKNGSYDRKTIDSYEAASFAAADDAAIDKMVDEYRKILNKDNKDITAKDIEFTNKMENLVYDMTKEGSHINVKGKIRDKISIIPPIQHKQ